MAAPQREDLHQPRVFDEAGGGRLRTHRPPPEASGSPGDSRDAFLTGLPGVIP